MFKRGWRVELLFLIVLGVLLTTVLPSAFALREWELHVVPIADRIFPDQEAKFDIYITNNHTQLDEYAIDIQPRRGWSGFTEPVYHMQGISVKGRTVGKTTVVLKADSEIDIGMYNITVAFTSSKSATVKTVGLITFVRDPSMVIRGYTPAVNVDVAMPEPVDPRKEITIKVNLWNRNRLNISDMTLTLQSSSFNLTRKTSLLPKEKKTEEFTVKLNPQQPAQEDALFVSLDIGDNHYTPLQRTYTILGYEDLQKEVKESSLLFKYTTKVHLNNAGNVVAKDTLQMPLNWFTKLFTATTTESRTLESDTKKILEIPYELQPAETSEIVVTQNYRPLVEVLILIILSIIAYYYFRSPIVIQKDAKALAHHDETATVKVAIHVKNRTGHVMEAVTILDALPHIAHLTQDFPLGTLKPGKIIKHDEKGTLIRWDMPFFEAFEERIITYTFTSRLKVIGDLQLPSTIVRFKTHRGKFVKIKSNPSWIVQSRKARQEKKSI